MQNTSAENSQLTLPRKDFSSGANPCRISFIGESPPFQGWWFGNNADNNGPVLVSTYTGGNGSQSILAGYSAFSSGGYNFTACHVNIENLCFRTPINPTLSALNLGGVLECSLDRVMCDVGGTSGVTFSWTQPTTGGATGIIFPMLNNAAVVRAGQVTAAGYYYGFNISEHLVGNNLQAFSCAYAATISASYHAIKLKRFGSYFNPNGIIVQSGGTENPRIDIDEYAIEQGDHSSTATASPAYWPARFDAGGAALGYDFIDTNNYAHGAVRYTVIKSNVGTSQASWRANGGSGMTFTSMG
jgi:hypothetical protein